MKVNKEQNREMSAIGSCKAGSLLLSGLRRAEDFTCAYKTNDNKFTYILTLKYN
jgi:hypothetical protein